MKSISLFALVFIAAINAFAASGSCPDKYETHENTSIQTIPGLRSCYIYVNSRNFQNMVYRDFLFDENGLFMVFNSFGNGPQSETTGAREFYFFPRISGALSYKYDANLKQVSVQAPSGKVFTFGTEKTDLISISNTKFTQDINIVKDNFGGIEITQNDGIYLDLGFTLGKSPSQNPQRRVRFKDSDQRVCTVKNSAIFNYVTSSDVRFKFTDADLRGFLGQKCPSLRD